MSLFGCVLIFSNYELINGMVGLSLSREFKRNLADVNTTAARPSGIKKYQKCIRKVCQRKQNTFYPHHHFWVLFITAERGLT